MMRRFTAQLSRELSAYFNSALAYVTLTVFLAISGVIFTIDMWHASAFSRPVNYGGTLSYLSYFALILSAFITMRLFAEEKNRGTIEILMTAPISDLQIVLAKYLGALGFFLSLLLPTLVFVAIMAVFGTVDVGAILMGYFGIFIMSAAFMAIGMLISSLAGSQMVAGIVSIIVSMALITISMVGGLIRDNESLLKQVFLYLSFTDQGSTFMQGVFDSRPLVFFLAFIALFVAATVGVVGARRWRDRRVALPIFLLTLALLTANLVMVYLISWRSFVRQDCTRSKRWELNDRTIQVLRKLQDDIYVVAYPFEGNPQLVQDATLGPAWNRFNQFMTECTKYSDKLHWQDLRPQDTQKTQDLQKIFKTLDFNTIYIYTKKLQDGPHKSIPFRELYQGNFQTGQITHWAAEPKLLQAINSLIERPRTAVYYTAGHREIGIRDPKDYGFNVLANKLFLFENVEFVNINLASVRQIPIDCQMLMILGPTEPFTLEECAVIDDYLSRGGNLFLSVLPDRATGLNGLMKKWGVDLDQRQIRVRGQQLGVAPGQMRKHRINEGFENVNMFVLMPCVIKPAEGVHPSVDVVPLITSGPGSDALNMNPAQWVYSDTPEGFPMAVAVAVADPEARERPRVKTRIVAWGSTANLWNQHTSAYPILQDYFLNTYKWLSAKEDEITAPTKVEDPPLRLSEREGWIVFGVSIFGLPLLGVLMGALTWFMRRK
jgi:ABC-2 type transport system permease protein